MIRNVLLILLTLFISLLPLMELEKVHAQSKKKSPPSQWVRKDPFALPPGVRLLSQEVQIAHEDTKLTPLYETTKPGEIKPEEIKPSEAPLKLKAILISDHVRLASIDRSIVTIGDAINGEKVIDIRPDRVVLEKEGKKRTLLLEQSSVKITVEGR